MWSHNTDLAQLESNQSYGFVTSQASNQVEGNMFFGGFSLFLTFFYSYYATITTKVCEGNSDKHYGMAKIFFISFHCLMK